MLMLKTGGTAIYNYPYYEYTVNNDSVTHSANSTIYMDGMYFYEKTREILDNELYADEQEYFHFKTGIYGKRQFPLLLKCFKHY